MAFHHGTSSMPVYCNAAAGTVVEGWFNSPKKPCTTLPHLGVINLWARTYCRRRIQTEDQAKVFTAPLAILHQADLKNICIGKLPDSWVSSSTALLQVFQWGLTGLEASWAFLTNAGWLSLLPSLAWQRLCLRVLSWANPSLRSCLTDWPRCSLLGQVQPKDFVSSDPLDGAWLTWRSLWILGSVGWARILS